MIAMLTGTIAAQTIDSMVFDVRGVGYEVFCPPGTAGRLRETESGELRVYIYTVVREDAFLLYGFASPEDKRVFERVISVNGVGPRLGLAILGALSPMELFTAVETNDLGALTKVSGIGKKTAQRIILELKSKLDASLLDALAPADAESNTLLNDLRSALQNMGYNAATIDSIVDAVTPKLGEYETFDDLLREAFKLLR